MNKIEILTFISDHIKVYRKDAKASMFRNKHMNDLTGEEDISQDVIDAILIDFVNFIGVNQGVDYGIYTSDLKAKEDLFFWDRELSNCVWRMQFAHQLRTEVDGGKYEIYHYKLNSFDTRIFYIDFARDKKGVPNGPITLFYCLSDESFENDDWVSALIPENKKELKAKLIDFGFEIK